ncbi:MAG TPA: 4a-hydroxytetrahydrobiopterin dehydratase [Phycisphaerales bacterium]|nr:4a-hydroxytetrahydrobiopterin dehydratase [Phycisphaerales bacterium]
MTTKLSEAEIQAALAATPEWSEVSGAIQRTYDFKDFVQAMRFVNKVAEHAEKVQHHPDILVRYNKVTISVSTHDAGGITAKDFALAKAVDAMTR